MENEKIKKMLEYRFNLVVRVSQKRKLFFGMTIKKSLKR